jgi:hypothetical protein
MQNPPLSLAEKTDLAILVVSCDAFQDVWHPFFACFFKYWPDCPYPIYLGSNFQAYPDSRVHSIRVGTDIDYSSNLRKMLEQVPAEWIIVWIEDRVLSAPVDTIRLQEVINYVVAQQAGYVKLLANHPFAFVQDSRLEVGEISKGTRYRVCMTMGLWNRNTMTKLLCPGESAWALERKGSDRSNDLSEKFFAPSWYKRSDPLIADVHLIIKGRLLRDGQEFLKQEGLAECLQDRALQTWPSYCYVKAYIKLNDIFFLSRWLWLHLLTQFKRHMMLVLQLKDS